MGTGRTLNKNPRTRPVKSVGEKVRRQKVQRQRLVSLGVDAEAVAVMDPKVVRTMLKRPAQVKKSVAKKATAAVAGAEA